MKIDAKYPTLALSDDAIARTVDRCPCGAQMTIPTRTVNLFISTDAHRPTRRSKLERGLFKL